MTQKKDFSNFKKLQSTGADLTCYSVELAQERSTRSLTLRRALRPTIAGVLGRRGPASNRALLFDPTKYPFLIPDVAVQTLTSGNPTSISQFASNILTCSKASPKFLSTLATSQQVCEALNNAFNQDLPESTIINLIDIYTAIFPLADTLKEAYIDGGIIEIVIEYLNCDSAALACNAILLIKALCDASVYARDSVLTFGVHTMLMNIAETSEDETTVIDACRTLASVFASTEQIDSSILTESVMPLNRLLVLPYPAAVCSILNAYVSITTHLPNVIMDIFDSGIVPTIIGMLENEELVASVLPLIGNLCASHPSHIQQMFDLELISHLTRLMQTPHCGDVFFVFSNLITTVPNLIMPFFDSAFIESAIEHATTSQYDIKKEVVYFIATFIIHLPTESLVSFIRSDVIDLIVEMLNCGVIATVQSCLEAIQKFALAISVGEADSSLISEEQWEDLHFGLEQIAEKAPQSVKDKAVYLMEKIESMSSK